MLPDYPKMKARLTEAYHERIRRSMYYHLGVFAQVRDTLMHEGFKNVTFRVDGSVGEMEPQKVEASANLQVNFKEIENLDAEAVCKLLDSLGEEMAKEKTKMFLASVSQAAKEVGNIIDSASKSPVEQLFEATEKIDLDFDRQGNPQFPTLIGGTTAMEKMKEAQAKIESDPELRQRFERLIQKKKDDWNDREADRNLVE